MKIEIIPFRARHVPLIKPEADADMLELAAFAEQKGHAFTGCFRGDPIGAAGIAVSGPRRAEVWTLFSPIIKQRFALSLFRHCKRLIDEVVEEAGIEKVTAVIDPDDEVSKRFITHLGFQMESHLYTREVIGGSR